jgi:hypothetical protein
MGKSEARIEYDMYWGDPDDNTSSYSLGMTRVFVHHSIILMLCPEQV